MGELLDRLHRNLGIAQKSEEVSEPEEVAWTDDDLIKPEDIASQDDDGIKVNILAHIGIVDAYRRWCGKMEPRGADRRTESIMVSCPNPAHPDEHPSAWLNSDKGVGNCATCGGFDTFDIYAWNSGRNVPGYRTTDFGEVAKEMAIDLGLEVRKIGNTTYIASQPEPEPEPEADAEPEEITGIAGVTQEEVEEFVEEVRPKLAQVMPIGLEEENELAKSPPIDWRNILDDKSTFLRRWMRTACGDDLPEEFYFWLGLQAVAAALGNNVQLSDFSPVRSNLMICLVGPSGMGKSRSTKVLKRLLRETFPWDAAVGGVKMLPEPASGEALVKEFSCPQYDASDPTIVVGWTQVRGIVQIDELAALSERAARVGSTMKTSMMQLFDTDEDVGSVSITGGSNIAREHFMQVVATTQPRLVGTLLSNKDAMSGFVNRWVFVTGKPKKMVAWGGYSADVTPLIPYLKEIRVWGGNRRIGLNKEAQEIWAEFFDRVLVPLKLDEDSPSFGRIDLLCKKLMLLFAADQQKKIVDADVVRQVLKLWPYLQWVYRFVGERTEISDEIREQKELELKLLRLAKLHRDQTGKDPSFRDIYSRFAKRDRNKHNRKAYMDAIKVLISTGELEEWADRKSGAGRPTIRYAITASGDPLL